MLSNFHSYAAKTKDNNRNTICDRSGKTEAAPWDIGSGHLNPDNAFNPDLLYDFELDDLLHLELVSNREGFGLVHGSLTWSDGLSRHVRSPILLNLVKE